MRQSTAILTLLYISSSTAGGLGQQETKPPALPPPAVVGYTGCVAKLPKLDKYVLASGKSCMLLRGKFDPAKVADHQVTMKGLLIQPVELDPLTLDVRETVTIKDSCKQTCVLEPPGTRGVHGKEKPGTEGGPAGLKSPPPPTSPISQ